MRAVHVSEIDAPSSSAATWRRRARRWRTASRHPDHGSTHYNAACFYARTRNRERALEHVRRALELEPEASGWARTDRDLDPLCGDPRFPAV